MGKRRRNGKIATTKKLDDGKSKSATKEDSKSIDTSPTLWFSSLQTLNPSPENSLKQMEVKLNKLDNKDLQVNAEISSQTSPNSGLKTVNFYGSKTPSFQFSLKKMTNNVTKQEKTPIKKNGQHRQRSTKRKQQISKISGSATKKIKKDDKACEISTHLLKNGTTINEEATTKKRSMNMSTILDIVTPESSPLDDERPLTNGASKMSNKTQQLCPATKHLLGSPNGQFSEVSSVHSEDSLMSGQGSIQSSLLLKGNSGEYYFSSDNSPDSTHNGPSKFFSTPSSSRSSQESATSSIENKELSGVLLGKESEDSSYSPSGNSTSPERQTSITRFFKSRSQNGAVLKSQKVERSKMSGKDKKMEQMYLDLGQKNFGHVTCSACGMVYTHAQPEDEMEHIRYHKKFVSGLRFNGWKDEHVVKEYRDGRVIMIKPDDHPSHQRKNEEIRKVVDSELGFAVDLPGRKKESKTFIFVRNKRVVGCCVATQIDKGYPVLPTTPNKDSSPDRQTAAWCCSTVPVPAQCGISKIWVWKQYRRKKVATRLIECVRSNFIYGCVVSKDLVAFSDPTPDGKRLAAAYTGSAEFLVFH